MQRELMTPRCKLGTRPRSGGGAEGRASRNQSQEYVENTCVLRRAIERWRSSKATVTGSPATLAEQERQSLAGLYGLSMELKATFDIENVISI